LKPALSHKRPIDTDGDELGGGEARRMWNALKRIAEAMDLSPEDRDGLFFKTAARTYRLDLSD